MPNLTSAANFVWQISASEAAHNKDEFIRKEHVLVGILSIEKIFDLDDWMGELASQKKNIELEYIILENILKGLALDMTNLRRAIRSRLPKGNFVHSDKVIHRSKECKESFHRANELGKGEISILTLFMSVMESPGNVITAALEEFQVTPERLREEIKRKMESEDRECLPARPEGIQRDKKIAGEFIWLNKFGRDLVKEAAEGKLLPIEGRRDEMLQVIRTLSRKTKNNPVLVGEAGVGKTAIVEGLAQRINAGKSLVGMRIFELSMSSLVGGAKYRGEFEGRLNSVIDEAKQHPEVILFLDEIHNLVGTGRAEGSMDAGNILKPELARGAIKCIGATTIAEYRRYIEKDAALERRFQLVKVNEPTQEETLKILHRLKPRFEEHHGVVITDEAFTAAVEMSVRYLPYRQLPDKAVDVIDEACAAVQMPNLSVAQKVDQRQDKNVNLGEVNEEKIAEVISEKTGIPVIKLTQDDVKRFLHLEEYLRDRVKGQEEAVGAIAKKIRLAKSGMRDKNKPLSVFLFLGPTGVGKTLCAKTIAEVLFGAEKEMIRIDMSEYKEKHSVSKLIGASPGYVGYEEEGQLTSKLRSTPYSVVLLDEVEKAHPEVLDIFLQLFDEGRLTDSKGRTIDGKNAIFIMTSNLASQGRQRIGFEIGATKIEEEGILSEIRNYFRPEFLNRIDKIIIFKHLDLVHIREIIRQQLNQFCTQMAEEYGMTVSLSEAVLEHVADVGYSEINGARAIQRTIEQSLKEPCSEEILRLQAQGKMLKNMRMNVEVHSGKIKLLFSGSDTR